MQYVFRFIVGISGATRIGTTTPDFAKGELNNNSAHCKFSLTPACKLGHWNISCDCSSFDTLKIWLEALIGPRTGKYIFIDCPNTLVSIFGQIKTDLHRTYEYASVK